MNKSSNKSIKSTRGANMKPEPQLSSLTFKGPKHAEPIAHKTGVPIKMLEDLEQELLSKDR